MIFGEVLPEFGEVASPTWGEGTTFIIGGGPSLRGFDFRRLIGRGHIIGVNRAMFDSNCDIGVSIDRQFVAGYADMLKGLAKVRTIYLALGNEWWKSGAPMIPGATYLRSRGDLPGLSHDPYVVHRGSTSGYCALNIAALLGARRIVLLGYDYKPGHYHNGYPWHHKANDQSMPAWAVRYPAAAEDCMLLGIDVINASDDSTLTCFRKMSIDQVLET